MTQRTLAVVLVLLAVLAAGAAMTGTATTGTASDHCSFPVEETDATGTEVTLEEPPEEVVMTAQSGAQIAWELDAQDRITGMPVGPFTAYLNGSREKTDITNEEGLLDAEQVVDLDPDLVIAPNATSVESVRQLREAGLTVYHFSERQSIADVQAKTRTVGRLMGQCDEADERVEWMDDRIETVEQTVPDDESPSVFYWLQGGFTAGNGTFQHELLETAGGENVAATIGIDGWNIASEEQIVEQNPEYLLLNEGTEVPDSEGIQSTRAVQNEQVITVNANYFSQPGPRIVLALEEIAQALHPEAFAEEGEDTGSEDGNTSEEDESETGDENESESGDEEDEENDIDGEESDFETDGTTEEDEDEDEADGSADDGTPGFGVVVAALALLSAGVALSRRD